MSGPIHVKKSLLQNPAPNSLDTCRPVGIGVDVRAFQNFHLGIGILNPDSSEVDAARGTYSSLYHRDCLSQHWNRKARLCLRPTTLEDD